MNLQPGLYVRSAVADATLPERAQARRQDDQRLFLRYRTQRDLAAREALVMRFLPLARHLARQYRRGDEPLEDLVQVASLALLQAIDRFDPQRATAFSSYAVPTILGELKRHFRDKGWSVRVPRSLQELALRIEPAVEHLTRELRRAPTVAELAQRLDVSVERLLEAREAAGAHRAVSLEAPPPGDDDGDETIGTRIGREDPGYARVEAAASVEPALSTLNAREREVLRLRFHEDLTQAEIGARIGISQMQVSRLIRQSIAQIRAAAASNAEAADDADPA
jgi:RNA polymerase sigma-B factor